MKLRIAILAVTIPFLAMLVSVWFSTHQDAPIDNSSITSETSTERPRAVQEPIRRPPDIVFPEEREISASSSVTSADIEEIRMRMLASIAEEFRASIEADIERSLSPYDPNAAWLGEVGRYRLDPAWPTIPVLPGVSGFEIQQCPHSRCLSDRLAEEPDDPAWARPMESRILAELPRHAERGLSQLFVVCRQRTCGVLLPALEDTASRLDLSRTASALATDLGFANHSVAERSDYQAIFLTTREQVPEMRMQ
jgi:hypothetical protein